jgi:hypothetical protein
MLRLLELLALLQVLLLHHLAVSLDWMELRVQLARWAVQFFLASYH